MTVVKVSVKWQNEVYDDVDVDTTSLDLLNATLFSLTNVPVDRQKLMLKGRIIKTNDDLSKVKAGMKLVMMGTADEVAAAPLKAHIFEEDLTDSQRATMGTVEMPAGLRNLGNTCYLNAALECLRAIPELKDGLVRYGKGEVTPFGQSSGNPDQVVSQMGQMMNQLDHSVQAVTPSQFLTVFRERYPQFAQRTPNGFSQQDADESLTQLLFNLGEVLKKFPTEGAIGDFTGASGLFKGRMISTITCAEPKEDNVTHDSIELKEHDFIKLRCHISGETNHLTDGMKSALEDSLEKNSPALGRNAIFNVVDRISQLPPYLIVQFVRFFWKKDTKKKAKIMRKVVFPLRLDMSPYCTPDLQKQLSAHRDEVDRKADEMKAIKDIREAEHGPDPKGATPAPSPRSPYADRASGMYELFALITHQGRAADSGHYIGYARGPNKSEWFKYDDDVVTKQHDDDIVKLFGGGDWPMAYLTFYRATSWRF